MASIKVSVQDILVAVHGLDGASLVAQRIVRRTLLRRGALDGCGHVRLARAGDELLAAWERAIGDLVEDATELSSLLCEAAQAYGYTEQIVATTVPSVSAVPAR